MQTLHTSPRIRDAALAAAVAVSASALTPHLASAALEMRTWVGETSTDWNTNANWSPTSPPLAADRIAVFDRAFTYQPAIKTHVTVIAGIWMTGDTVGDVIITSSPDGQNSGKPTFQTRGNTINGIDGVGILMDNTSSGNLTIATSAFKVEFSQTWINNSANLFTIAADTNLAGATATITGSGNTLISGNITNSTGTGRIIKEGTGTLTLAGETISYNGETTVNSGTLLVTGTMSSGSALVTVNGGTLGGTGTIGRTTTIHEGATLAPGLSSDSAGTLTINRNLTIEGTAAFDLIGAGENDKVFVNAVNEGSRTLTFGGTLVVTATDGMTFAPGQVFDLFDWGDKTAVTGTFDSIQLPTLTGGLSWQMFGDQPFDYQTGQIVVVPEPVGGIALGGLAVLLTRRRRS